MRSTTAVGIDRSREAGPDATTLLNFRRLLERDGLTKRIIETIKAHLVEKGLTVREATIVDFTLITAPPSTKNREKARAPQVQQTKERDQYYFGMKAYIGVDANCGLMHLLATTAANTGELT